MFSKVNSLGLQGFTAALVDVEVDLSSGLPRFDLVGLPDSAVSEAKERVRSAIKNSNLDFPISRITVNLAPAEFRKEGPIYDLPILIAILLASKQLKTKQDLSDTAFVGEISLNGVIRRINGVLPMTAAARHHGINKIFIPYDNLQEALLVPNISIYPVQTLKDIIQHFTGEKEIKPCFADSGIKYGITDSDGNTPDFSDVIGQQTAKRALEIAAAGGHNILLIGSPGSGKSMLAKRLRGILPDMSFDEVVATTSVYSVAGVLRDDLPIVQSRPFRAPHHTTSLAAFAGGGRRAMPGEISLAHNGVLFLDELPLFPQSLLETLRQPLEDGQITVRRNIYSATYPAQVMLVAAMNPCPCGYALDPIHNCVCSELKKERYLSRLSGPLIDRIDIAVQVDPPNCNDLIHPIHDKTVETSAQIKVRVNRARDIQRIRFNSIKSNEIYCNSQMTSGMVRKYCVLTNSAKELLLSAYERLSFSARVTDKILKTARTIADLDASDLIEVRHIAETLQYRSFERLTDFH